MSATGNVVAPAAIYAQLSAGLDARTQEILERRRTSDTRRRRGWLMRRMLLGSDLGGLIAAFLAVEVAFALFAGGAFVTSPNDLVFAAMLPGWIVLAKLEGLYDHDGERADHTTVDEIAAVFQTVTVGTWLYAVIAWASGIGGFDFDKLLAFWLAAIVLVTAARIGARSICHKSITYLQNTVIVGAGEIGQLVARKVLHHPEYGLNVVGFVDFDPKERRSDLGHLTLLGSPDDLPAIVRLLDVERVVVAFSRESHEETIDLVRTMQDLNVQIDIVPRLFEIVGPNVEIHSLEGLPLLGLPPARISRSSMLLKRAFDVVAALVALALTAPLFAVVALLIRRDSPGPVLFQQRRLGMNMREFTLLKFRTMHANTDDAPHRAYIERLMSGDAAPTENGLFKLDRELDVTRVGRWLRRTSLDELPQLINVLRGDMSLVGPRPCIPYETEHFARHHFERFLVPAGITGLWQVTARAHTTFSEALDMDVTYARGWSTALDFTLVLRTFRHVLTRPGTT
jgi:exopolysaccharide biosynthesis polyprenyl glycosylphosphotransferase